MEVPIWLNIVALGLLFAIVPIFNVYCEGEHISEVEVGANYAYYAFLIIPI